MRARLNDSPARGNSWLAEAYLANFSSYWLWYRLYDQHYLREVLESDVHAQVRLPSPEEPDATCTMPDEPQGPEQKCGDWFDVRIPRGRGRTLALVRVRDGMRFEMQANVRQLTILGLGDSFGSGEGTPDVPADLAGRPPPGGSPTRTSIQLRHNGLNGTVIDLFWDRKRERSSNTPPCTRIPKSTSSTSPARVRR